ncbi:hypothetical protein IFT59_14220 [Rhizobium sp. CFBP 8752]|uniref:hypothetical protein n=1 Tax=Rhizobium sp. CFBP 8752 TaxID=2775301 RepID=UPI00177AD378|nr:hypothetical protein [Rhizobium sp. CFBP 8752]MBD8664397.1 hypothetical protein [Rhizobium sp. CFBP 8752]
MTGLEGMTVRNPPVTEDADKTLIENDGHQRFKESVDTTRTPEQERKDASEKTGTTGYGTTK